MDPPFPWPCGQTPRPDRASARLPGCLRVARTDSSALAREMGRQASLPTHISSLERLAGLESGCRDARVVRDAEALLRQLVRVRAGVLEDVDAHVLVGGADVPVHEDRVAPREHVGRARLADAPRHALRVPLGVVARPRRPFRAPADLGGGLVEEEAELERRLRIRDVDRSEASAVPRREKDARESQCVVYRLGAAHDVLPIDADPARVRRALVTRLRTTVGGRPGDREGPDVPRGEIAAERSHRALAAGGHELAGLAVIGREAVVAADGREGDAAERAGVTFVVQRDVRTGWDLDHAMDVRHLGAEGREGLEVWEHGEAVPGLLRALCGRDITGSAFRDRGAVDLEVAVLGLREVHALSVDGPGHVVGLGAV